MSYIGKEPQFTQYPSKFFNGDGTAMTVTLDYSPPNAAALLVFIDGVRQDTSAYTLSGTSLTFTGAVPSGTNNVQVVHLGIAQDTQVPVDDSVSTVKIQDDAVTSAKLDTNIAIDGDLTVDTDTLYIDSTNNNVGIGTSAPLGKLKVAVGDNAPAASGDMNTGVVFESASASRAINIGVNNTAGYSWINAAFANNSGIPDNLVLMTGATERMRIDSSGNLQFDSGYGSTATAYGCRAWVNFNGTGTVAIRESGNVSSVTDSAVGRYTVNFLTSLPDNVYSVVSDSSAWIANSSNLTTSSISVDVFNGSGTFVDSSQVMSAIFR
jgi:hypothetical protein